tara:strand:+ start:66481 stop:67305 length:825 start_codon:yes stop_codon:yes gene_type:complete
MAYSSGKVAVLTGAGSGIGRALAQQLNREGCQLYLSDINPETLQATLSSLGNPGAPAAGQVLDVADKAAVHAWAEDIGARHGHIDILVNNAGVGLMATVADSDYDNLEWLMGINFWGVVYGTMAFLPLLRKSPQANLVNISSLFGIIAVPTQSAYNAAKFAVRGYTESLRQEMEGTQVRVCCVHPGGIKTNIARNSRGGDALLSADERSSHFDKFARTTAESAAQQIIRAMEKNKKRLLIGADAKIVTLISRLFPVGYTRFIPDVAPTKNEVSV